MINQNLANRAHMTQMAPALSIGDNFLVLTRFPGGGKGWQWDHKNPYPQHLKPT